MSSALLRRHGALAGLVVLFVVFAWTADGFLGVDNLRVLAQNAALPALIACGVTVGILAGQFDLSVGATFGLSGVVAAIVADRSGVPEAVAAGVAVGALVGGLNGALVAGLGMPSFLVTLATGFVILGIGLVITGGSGSWPIDHFEAMAPIAQGTLATLQYRVWIVAAVFGLTAFALARTRAGRQVYAVGGSAAAARIAGVRTRVVVLATFVVAGSCAGLAGVIGAADTGVAQSAGGTGMEFSAITAVIIGGTSILGGRGNVGRSLVGVLLLAVIANGFTLLYVDPTYNSLVQGAIILAAIVAEARLRAPVPA